MPCNWNESTGAVETLLERYQREAREQGTSGANGSSGESETKKAEAVAPLPLKERIRLAREHVERHGQMRDALWPHQRFALTIGELLDAAERGA